MESVDRLLGNTHPALRRGWHPVARSAEVGDRPRRVLLLGEPWVLYRVAGRPVAFVDRCPHRRAPLSLGQVTDGVLRCAYHGWCFADDGRCLAVPALGAGAAVPSRARLDRPAGLAERHGLVFLAPGDPLAPLPELVEADQPGFVAGDLAPIEARAAAGLLADNFLDMAHFPFVHAKTFGADESAEIHPYSVQREGLSFTAVYEHLFSNREDAAVARGVRPLVQRRRLTYRYHAPFHLVLRIDFLDAGGSNVVGLFLQPMTEERCRVYSTLWRDDLDGDPARMAEAVAFEEEVLAEDLAVQEAFDHLVLPLDLTVELHTRVDKTTVELRRILAELVERAADADRDMSTG